MVTQNASKLKKHPFEHRFIPAQIKLLINSNKGSKNYYLSQFKSDNAQEDFQTYKNKWNRIIKNSISIKGWETAYRICFECLDCNIIKWFQYRVLNLILGTRSYLYELKIVDTHCCGYSSNAEETVTHLLCYSTEAKSLWTDLKSSMFRKTQVILKFDPISIVFGYFKPDCNFLSLNIIYLITKNIFSTA